MVWQTRNVVLWHEDSLEVSDVNFWNTIINKIYERELRIILKALIGRETLPLLPLLSPGYNCLYLEHRTNSDLEGV